MTINLWVGDRARATLTTEDAASSHGIPVLVVDGIAYGPDDRPHERHKARAFVAQFLLGRRPAFGRWAPRTAEALDAARRFLGIE